jgi:uncharacterized phage protein (TIGR01671 family)
MSKEKYRAWDTKKEEMTKDFPTWINGDGTQSGTGKNLNQIISDLKERYILMQSTGLEDKNGKEMYELDYIKPERSNKIFKFVYRQRSCQFVLLDGKSDYDFISLEDDQKEHHIELPCFGGNVYYENFEVIGNKFQNPDLLNN